MDPKHLETLDAAFASALEVPVDARAGWLMAHVADPILRRDLEALLVSHDHAVASFDELADRIAEAAVLEIEGATREGIRIDAYRTLQVIGHGGMGTVFLAERADGQYDQRVALKLMRLGVDSDLAALRFVAERQIVARLDHPNIAHLIDGGITSDGRPYFVMEYVEGATITTHADQASLPIEARLRLFLDVADALRYAHSRLVVHRDVKPRNVLVTLDGRVKLLDFGIAKMLATEDAPDVADLTRTRERALTPAYAAPEQIRGEAITTSVDVYALGVVLYELLTGRRPFEPEGLSETAFERQVLDDPAPRPSDTLVSDGSALARSSRPDRLQRLLRGDLDTICLTALRKEPERRYQSVEQLAEDVRRHLAGLPIAAHPDSVGYRAGKFVRRHRTGVAAAVALLVLSIGFSVVLGWQSVRLARERDKAQQVASLFVDMFQVADPSESRGATVTAREVLDRGVERIRTGLDSQPEVRAALLEVVARVYVNLGLYLRAKPLLEDEVATRRALVGAEHRDVATAMSALGELLRLTGEYPAAERTLRDALTLHERGGLGESVEAARTMNHLAKVLIASGKLSEAEALSRDALRIAGSTVGRDHEEAAESLNNIAAVRFTTGDDLAAEPLFREALDIRRRRLGADHPLVPAALNNLASLLSRKGDHAAAESAYREALAIYRQLFGDEHPRVATTLNNLGLTYFAAGNSSAAEPLLGEALTMRRKLLPAGHPEIAQSASNLGLVLQTAGRLDEAEILYREALAARQKALGETHPLFAQSVHNLGLLRQARGALDEAEQLFERSLGILEKALGPEHALVATNRQSLGGLFEARRNLAEARRHYEAALSIRAKVLPAGHPERVATEAKLATLTAGPAR